MKQIKRITALILCMIMMVSSHGIEALAAGMPVILQKAEEFMLTSGEELTAFPGNAEQGGLASDGEETGLEETGLEETDGEETDGEETDGEETDGEETDGEETGFEETVGEETGLEETDGEEAGRINVILPLEPIKKEAEEGTEPYIYWNPGAIAPAENQDGQAQEVPKQQASPADAVYSETGEVSGRNDLAQQTQHQQASPADAIYSETGDAASRNDMAAGRDSADGLTPDMPVKSLKTALKKAERLAEVLGVEAEEITIYAMNPMEIRAGQAYFYRGKQIPVAPWPERSDNSNLIFYVNGGQLTLRDIWLGGEGSRTDGMEPALIQVDGGKVQFGEGVDIQGTICMNYQTVAEDTEGTETQEREIQETETQEPQEIIEPTNEEMIASPPDASVAGDAGNDTGDGYVKDTQPVIELLEDFVPMGSLSLDIRADSDIEQVEVVRALYADETTEEEFTDLFQVVETGVAGWELSAKAQESGTVRRIGEEEEHAVFQSRSAALLLTKKSLIASRAAGEIRYWNPGSTVVINGITYIAGNDENHNGTSPDAPFKTLTKAITEAKGGTVICVQPLTLDAAGHAEEYLSGQNPTIIDGSCQYKVDGIFTTKTTITPLPENPQGVFVLETNTELAVKHINFGGSALESGYTSSQTVLCHGGQLILEEHVSTTNAFIQVDLGKEYPTAEHPIQVNSDTVACSLFYGGINDNLNYRFLDVVVPGGSLAPAEGATQEQKDAVGKVLLENIRLDTANTVEGGGRYPWVLRQDTPIDNIGDISDPQNLELYADYYYDAVYIDGQNGDDTSFGAFCLNPVKTMDRALQLLDAEMKHSIEKRAELKDAGENYMVIAMPTKIYICGTIDLSGEVSWVIPPYTDVDGTAVSVEMETHTDIPVGEDGLPRHDLPVSLIRVKGETSHLTLGSGITIRSLSGIENSATVSLTDGAALTMTGNASMTGAVSDVEGARKTLGTHIAAGYEPSADGTVTPTASSSTVNLTSEWTGTIAKKGVGIHAVGASSVNMDSAAGSISQNDSSQDRKGTRNYGSGVICEDTCIFTMKKGVIEKNQSKFGGAGVYLTDEAEFYMGQETNLSVDECRIDGNGMKMSKEDASGDAYGVGLFAAENTRVQIQKASVVNNYAEGYLHDMNLLGIGIYVGGNAAFTMTDSSVNKNYSNCTNNDLNISIWGLALYISGSQPSTIRGGEIAENVVLGIGYGNSLGVVVINSPGTQMIGMKIHDNKIYGDYGIIVCRSSVTEGQILIKQCTIANNICYEEGADYAAAITSFENLRIEDTTISDNQSKGIYVGAFKKTCQLKNVYIERNEPIWENGAGIYAAGPVVGYNVHIKNNKTGPDVYGGGIFVGLGGGVTLTDSIIEGNFAGYGGGIYTTFGTVSITGDSRIVDNTAVKDGGGIFCVGGNSDQDLLLDLQYPLMNTSETGQGNNLYITGNSRVSLLSGTFCQPAAGGTKSCYNVFISLSNRGFYSPYVRMDPKKVTFEGERKLFLNTSDSVLTYLDSPPDQEGGLPIDLNKAAFEVGSTVIQPADLSSVTIDTVTSGLMTVSKEIEYPRLKDASAYVDSYYKGADLPEYTSLGAYLKNGKRNVILIGEGVYLDGEKGLDSHTGTSPDDAVKTFLRAKELLITRIQEAEDNAADQDGFLPFIYLCGGISVDGNESWELDPKRIISAKYEAHEKAAGKTPEETQLRRFTAFVDKPMIDLAAGSTFMMDDIIINGMMGGVQTGEQGTRSPIVSVGNGAALTLGGDANLKDNYYSVLNLNAAAKLTLTGTEGEKNRQVEVNSSYGIYAKASSIIDMNGLAAVILKNDSRSGICLDEQAKLTMSGTSRIISEKRDYRRATGVELLKTSGLVMKDSSAIYGCKGEGILAKENSTITLQDSAKLESNEVGIETVLKGYSVEPDSFIKIIMSGNSQINGGIGLTYLGGTAGINMGIPTGVTMSGTAAILNHRIGIDVKGTYMSVNASLELKEQAALTQNRSNICIEEGDNSLELSMKGSSRIAGRADSNPDAIEVSRVGILIESLKGSSITMSGDSVIEGHVESGIQVASSRYSGPYENQNVITISENAKIRNNGDYGIYVGEESYSSTRKDIITLKGQAEISGHQKGAICMQDDQGEVHIEEQAVVDAYAGYDETVENIYMKSPLYLAGTATVHGRIYLANAAAPITMTAKVPTEQEKKPYWLRLADGFVGKPVVCPDGSNTTDVSDQLRFFEKRLGDGMAAEKELLSLSPNLVLQGENNVYISGKGNDDNSGNTPLLPVRTFKRAKELLQTGPYTAGASILFVDSVEVLEGDENWGFDEGGYLTNQVSDDAWKPLLKPYSEYSSEAAMIGLATSASAGMAKTLEMKDLTITSREYEAGIARCLEIGKGSAILGDGTIIEEVEINGDSVIYVGSSGRLTLDGAVIQQCRQTAVPTYSSMIYSEGKVLMKSGEIRKNELVYRDSGTDFASAMIVLKSQAEFVMEGGAIEENTAISRTADDTAANTIRSYEQSSVTVTGGSIRNNQASYGSAIYQHSSYGGLRITGGTIAGNTTGKSEIPATGSHAPVHVDYIDPGKSGFELEGGASIRDGIYLNNENIITLTAPLIQSNRVYQIYLSGSKGRGVVRPDGKYLKDARPYLSNFQVKESGYILDWGRTEETVTETEITGMSAARENQCLLLVKAVFLDSQTGEDSNSGTVPEQAVRTFAKAVETGRKGSQGEKEHHYVIYISGPVTPEDGENWSVTAPAYLCRYTGFELEDSSGNKGTGAYRGYLVEPKGNLSLSNIPIYGRRPIDSVNDTGESILHIKSGAAITIGEGTILSRNRNIGHYDDEELKPLSSKGGALTVEAGGTAVISGGSVTENDAAYGSAIYVAGAASDPAGTLVLDNSPVIDGDVYLAGRVTGKEAVVSAKTTYIPKNSAGAEAGLSVRLEHDYDKRPVICYPEASVLTGRETEFYLMENQVTAIYDFQKSETMPNVLELDLKQIMYVDGVTGDDSHDGKTPETAKETIRGVYHQLEQESDVSGILIFVVDTVTVRQNETITVSNEVIKSKEGIRSFKSVYTDGTGSSIELPGQVFFKRYVKPEQTEQSGYTKASNAGTLFEVIGTLNFNGVYLDGHSVDNRSGIDYLSASGIRAKGPLVAVEETGSLNCAKTEPTVDPSSGDIAVSTQTIFRNNTNTLQKDKVIGEWPDTAEPIMEGSAAGVEVLGGSCILNTVRFENLALEGVGTGGTDVYSNGILKVDDFAEFTGSVFLEGMKSEDTSKWLIVEDYGQVFKLNFQLRLRDPYDGRKVVEYPNMEGHENGPADKDLGYFLMDENINKYFALHKRDGAKYILELKKPMAVYIDGVNGADDAGRGWVPTKPVKTLKQAYSLLQSSAGRLIYVVNTVDITDDTILTGKSYVGNNETVVLLDNTDRVEIRRYVKPLVFSLNQEYQEEDFQGALIRVKNGADLTLQGYPDDNTGIASVFVVDGESRVRNDPELPAELVTDHGAAAGAPLFQVEEGATLTLNEDVALQYNNNLPVLSLERTLSENQGGALYNAGTVIFNQAVLTGNQAVKGAGIYQNGIFTIQSGPEGLKDQEIYLSSVQRGTDDWEDKTIRTDVWLADTLQLQVNMDHAVAGRDVAEYTVHSKVDEQYGRYQLGETVPKELFLAEDPLHDNILELQDWRILDVTVPEEIFLVIAEPWSSNGAVEVKDGASNASELAVPEYRIVNNGRYQAKVSLAEFTDDSQAAGIDSALHDPMALVDTKASAVGASQLYLAVKGVGDDSNPFKNLAETTLSGRSSNGGSSADGVLTETVMGTLDPGQSGTFTFMGTASRDFTAKYQDSEFPLTGEGDLTEIRKNHYRTKSTDGSPSKAKQARAKFTMGYRIELVPARREP